MTKQEYIRIVSVRLSGLNPAEVNDALDYLNEYFEEAGPDGEQEAIRELGAPEKYASIIWADLLSHMPPAIPADAQRSGPVPQGKPDSSLWKNIGIALAGICALPIAVPLILAALALAMMGILFFILLVVMAVMIFIMAILALGSAIWTFAATFGQDMMLSLFLFGAILCGAGVCILLWLGLSWFFRKGTRLLSGWIVSLYTKLRSRETSGGAYEA